MLIFSWRRFSTSIQRREEQIDELDEEIEKKRQLIGISVIEGKLQDDVSQSIERLTEAGNQKLDVKWW